MCFMILSETNTHTLLLLSARALYSHQGLTFEIQIRPQAQLRFTFLGQIDSDDFDKTGDKREMPSMV